MVWTAGATEKPHDKSTGVDVSHETGEVIATPDVPLMEGAEGAALPEATGTRAVGSAGVALCRGASGPGLCRLRPPYHRTMPQVTLLPTPPRLARLLTRQDLPLA